MRTETLFTLRDGSTFTDINKALNHCQEQMGAETRTMLQSIMDARMIYSAALQLVVDKKHDSAIRLYIAWRDEHDLLLQHQTKED